MTILALQPDPTDGIDTRILSLGAGASNNYGVETAFSAGLVLGAGETRALIKFTLPAFPAGTLVVSATLSLWCSTETVATDFNVALHRSLVQWYEGVNNAAAPGAGVDGSTWDHRNANGSVAWGAAGGLSGTDYAAVATDTELITTTGQFFDWDVTTDVAGYIDTSLTNHGWWLIGENVTDSRKFFRSSDYVTTPSQRPTLTIDYVVENISGSTAGQATVTGTLVGTAISGSAAGAATAIGALVGWGLMIGSAAGLATVSGAMPVQEMSGSAAGLASVSGGGRAVLLPRVPIWTAIIAGVEYALSGGNPFYRLQATGLGISNIRNIKQRGPFQDGATRRDFRLDERFLNLVFLLQGATRAQADTYRDTLIEIFKPLTDTPCQIKVTRDDGVIKQIDTYAVGVLDIPETEDMRFAATQRVMVQLEAPNPIWYGPTLQNLGFTTVLGGTAGFQIPMMIPWVQQSGEYINVTESFFYEGNWKEYPVIVITGPAIDAKITNLTTNEKIDFTGYTIAAGDTRTIDLRFGTKTVKDAAGVLKNSELTSDSNLGTFHLEPSPGATGGINDIKVEILGGGTTETRVSIQYYNRYIHL